MPTTGRRRATSANAQQLSWWLFAATSCLFIWCPLAVQGQSGDAFVEAVVSHLKISPFLVNTLNATSYPQSFYVQDNVELVNVSVVNLLNLRREGPWDLLVDSDGLMHLRGALNLSDVRVRAGYRYHRWLTTLNGHVSLRLPQLKLQLHATLANLTNLGLRAFRVAGIIPPQVVEFSGTTTLFNWIGARRVQSLMDASTNTLVENLENFVRIGVSTVMQGKRYSSQRGCHPQGEENQQKSQNQLHGQQQQQYLDALQDDLETQLTWTDYTIQSNGSDRKSFGGIAINSSIAER